MAKPWVKIKRCVDAAVDARLNAQAAAVVKAARALERSATPIAPGVYRMSPMAMIAVRAALAELDRRADTAGQVGIRD